MKGELKIKRVGRWFALKNWARDVFMTPTYLFKPFLKDVTMAVLGFLGYFLQMLIAFGYALTGRMKVFELDPSDIDKE